MISYDLKIIYFALKDKVNLSLFLALSSLLSLGYIYLLNFLVIGSFYISEIFLSISQIVFAIIIGILLSLVIVLNYQSFKLKLPTVKGSVLGAIIATFVNGFCCSPVIPTLISFFATTSPAIIFLSASVQAFFAFNYLYFYITSIALLICSIHKICNNINCCVFKNEK
jgi:hypothetical protein